MYCLVFDNENKLSISIGKGLLEDRGPNTDFLCLNWGMTFVLFSYDIANNYMSIREEGIKIIGQEIPLNETEKGQLIEICFLANNILVAILSNSSLALLHFSDFNLAHLAALPNILNQNLQKMPLSEMDQFVSSFS